jgi:alkanesulfonate monooxygenase SsuD/methylene tetrahydromethanopterin reductase-like flavin-dependent oxidoreductase (luciferase family)
VTTAVHPSDPTFASTWTLHTDVVIDPFGADVRDMIEVARVADAGGFGGAWTLDHFSGDILGQPWSRDPFTVMGAVAASTRRLRVGVLVANMKNRHPAQLASAVNTLQSIAPGRVVCGVGSGAGPTGPFSTEFTAIGVQLERAERRRYELAETVAALRAIWRGEPDYAGHDVAFSGLRAVVDGSAPPPFIIGATSAETVALACACADGVNIRRTGSQESVTELVALAHQRAPGPEFEIDVYDQLDLLHPLGGDPTWLRELGVHRRTLLVSPPFDFDAIGEIGVNLSG